MKEDVLEQIVDDYLQFKGYFTTHNVRFKPDPSRSDYIADLDRVSSDRRRRCPASRAHRP
jgi:hypothetical protein